MQYVMEDVAAYLGRDIRLDVLCGTSVGALNACMFAAFADLGRKAAGRIADLWTKLRVVDLLRPDARGILHMGARLLGRGGAASELAAAREGGLIDPAGLERFVQQHIPFHRIQDNLDAGRFDALTVSTTLIGSGLTVVHVQRREPELPSWSHDPTTVACAARITAQHALASAAIPILFRAVKLDGDWHCDGGLRQNVPLSPARRLGAGRVLVVNPRFISAEPRGGLAARDFSPGPLFVLGKMLNALMLDRIDADLARLETINHILAAGARVCGPGFADALNRELGFEKGEGLHPMRTMLVRPSRDVGCVAAEFVRSPRCTDIAGRLIRRLVEPGSCNEADLLSYVLFDGAFAGQLIELGRADARAHHAELCAFFAEPS